MSDLTTLIIDGLSYCVRRGASGWEILASERRGEWQSADLWLALRIDDAIRWNKTTPWGSLPIEAPAYSPIPIISVPPRFGAIALEPRPIHPAPAPSPILHRPERVKLPIFAPIPRIPPTPKGVALKQRLRAQNKADRKRWAADEAKKAARDERMQRLIEVAAESNMAPDDLRQAAEDVCKERRQFAEEREAAKADARRLTGVTAGDLARMENAHQDYSSVAGWDAAARQIARNYPGLIGDADGDDNLSDALWGLIREGTARMPQWCDDEILREAAVFAACESF